MIYIVFLGMFFIFLGSGYMLLVSKYPGYVLISLGENAIEFNIWFLMTAIVLVLIIFRLGYRLTQYCFSSVGTGFSWIRNNSHVKNTLRTQSGLIRFVEGDWLKAKKELLASLKNEENPLLHYLLAANCAHKLGHVKEAQFLLEQAASDKKVPQDSASIPLTNANILLSEKKYQECLDVLTNMSSSGKESFAYLNLRTKAYVGLGQWNELSSMLTQIKRSDLYSKEEYELLRIKIYSSLLDADVAACDGTRDGLEGCWQKVPKDLRLRGEMLGLYCTALHRFNFDDIAAPIIQKTLKSSWHRGLVELYGKLNVSEYSSQLTIAESWLDKHPDDAYLLCALARISRRNSLWGKTRDYFESSLKIKERPEVYAELAALMAQLGDDKKSHDLYQKGLLLKIA